MHARRPQDSDTTITELMIPSYANFGGKIHGGMLLSLMDKVAYACATKHAGNYCVTVSVDTVDFLKPVEVGDLVSLMARVNHVGNSSLVIGIKVITENVKKRTVKHTNTSYFTMVAKNDNNKTTKVPPLLLTSQEEVRRFAESILRKELKDYHRKKMNENKSGFDLSEKLDELNKYNCKIELEE
ncbi:MAG: acyl-CoA thioesterase [Cyclobacteriaceae bacterium]|nr:acyl-CoA thioesterase [Cyclobacteriaceae bacterium]